MSGAMRVAAWVACAAVLAGCFGGSARNEASEPSLAAAAATPVAPATRRSGFEYMGASTQAMQRDDTLNPGMLWVKDGEAAWATPAGASNKSCRDCHGNAADSMRGVAARHPAWSEERARPVDLGERIALCRERRQQAPARAREHAELLGLEAYVAFQSRGMPTAPPDDPRLAAWRARGEALYQQAIGQLGLSCAQCHDERAGLQLAGNAIPQAHPTGYPIYRLEWQGVGSLQRRIRGCMAGVRAEPFAWNSEEMVALQAYLAQRAAGMPMEAPGVRP